MAKWTSFYKIVQPKSEATKITDSQVIGDQGSYGNYTWYQRLIQGSASRITRYREYDLMDNDVEVALALDCIAEEMTGNNPKTDDPLELDIIGEDDEDINITTVLTLKTALQHWSRIHDWENRLFKVARTLSKYGDCFFIKRHPLKRWEFCHPKNVVGAIVDQHDVSKVLAWQIKKDMKATRSTYGTPVGGRQEENTEIISAEQIVRFTLNDDMDDTAPFGESVLRPIYRSHKQKELLEDAILIYRIVRAPERRVYYIDVGKMPPPRVKQYLETIKNEIKQRKIPSPQGGKSEIDSVYNPQSMNEDFFFAQRSDGKGTKVETLPGGQGLGELTDLEYFQEKVWRGLRVPSSYMRTKSGENALFNDGKVGQAYIEELRFALFVQRLQGHVEKVMEDEFKTFLRKSNVVIDDTIYRIRLPEPSNFGIYRQQEVDAAVLNSYSTADGIPHLSKRFSMKRFMQLTDEEIAENEQMVAEERGIADDDPQKVQKIYQSAEEMMAGGGAPPMAGGGGMPPGMSVPPEEGMEGEMGAEGGEAGGAPGAEAAPPPEAGGPAA